MAGLPRRAKKRLVLDIGTSAIRLCELSQTKTGYQLTKYLQKEYNSDPALDEETRRKLRRDAASALLKESKVRAKKTIFAVPGQSVFTRTRTLPPVPEYKVTQIVKYEIQQQIPFGLDQIAMDYQVLHRTEAGGYDVMMAAIKTDVVDKHMDVLNENKRAVDIVDVSPLAAYNWLKHTGEFGDQGECVALIDMGATTTDIIIERGAQFRFTRPLNVGGNDITKAMASAFNQPFTDVERIKRERGFAPTGDAEKDGPVGEVIGTVLQRVVGEIMRSFAYFRSLPGGGPVNRVILCGGGACLRNIVPYMQRQLGMDVRIAQPLAGLATAPTAQQVNDRPEQACVVLGLALRNVQAATLEINLIPPRVLEARHRKEQALYWAMSLVTLGLIMASIIPVSAAKNQATLQRIDSLKNAISRYDPEVASGMKLGTPAPRTPQEQRLSAAKSDISGFKNDVETLDLVRKNRRFWLDEILLVADARPTDGGDGIWFSTVQTATINQGGGGNRGGGGQPNRPGGGLSAFAARQGGGAAAGVRGGGAGLNINASGFPGLESGVAVNPRGGQGGGLLGGNRGGGGRQGNRQNATPTIDKPNGLILYGFAESDVAIKEYRNSLQNAQRTTADGGTIWVSAVHFSEAEVTKCDRSIMLNSPVDRPITANDCGDPFYIRDPVFSFTLYVELKYGRKPQGGGGAGGNQVAGGGNQPGGGNPPV